MATPCGVNWTSLVTWILVFVGWFAVHKATLSRERRKEKREAMCVGKVNHESTLWGVAKMFPQLRKECCQLTTLFVVVNIEHLRGIDTQCRKVVFALFLCLRTSGACHFGKHSCKLVAPAPLPLTVGAR